jgi:hypothetical protein
MMKINVLYIFIIFMLIAISIVFSIIYINKNKYGEKYNLLTSVLVPYRDNYILKAKFYDPVTYILIPQRDREIYMEHLLRDLPKYIDIVHPGMKYIIVIVTQDQDGKYNKSLSLNVGLSWLHNVKKVSIDSGVIIHDVDVIPISGVDYSIVDIGTVVSCFMTIGGMKARLDQFVKCNGYPSNMIGWGYEDMIVWLRITRLCNIPMMYWWDTMDTNQKAIVKNLEWKMDDIETQNESKRYWKMGAKKIKFISNNISEVHERTWSNDVNTTKRNWCFYNRNKQYEPDVFSRVTNSDGLNNIDISGIRMDNKNGIYYLSFAVKDVLHKNVYEPEDEWYKTKGPIPDNCNIDFPK